ncbi:MAG: alpha/beta hydrolase [Solirubrobacterales bacterium]
MLDPQIQMLVDNIPGGIALPVGDVETARTTFRTLTVALRDAQPPADLAAIEDSTVPGAAGDLPARVYRPHGDAPTTTMMFIHGGGFVVGDIESYDFQARTLAEKSGATVLSVHYRLAPEDPFPAGVDDALAAAEWTLSNVDSLGRDPANVIVAGDSAGGNLAAVVAQQMRGRSPGFSGQLLLYPVVDFVNQYPSYEAHADGPVLTRTAAEMFDLAYIQGDIDRSDPRMSPLLAEDLAGLPPAVVATAEYDVLSDAGKAYAAKLAAAGVPTTHLHYDTLPHGFLGFGPLSEGALAAIDEVAAAVGGLVVTPSA